MGVADLAISSSKSKNRLIIILGIIGLIFLGLVARLFIIMFINADELQAKAEEQWTREFDVSAKRGDILDTNGNVLAHSATIDTIYVNLRDVEDPRECATQLSTHLDLDFQTVFDKITSEGMQQVFIKRQVDKDTANLIRELNIPGVGFAVDTKRYYPNGDLLTSVLGFTTTDGVGLEGIEAKYDKYLSGSPGVIIGETDNSGKAIPYGDSMFVEPEDGYNIVLYIDEVIQMFLEKSLEDAAIEHGAVGAQGIVMDPKTGEILAAANYPDFDLNEPPRHDITLLQDLVKNKAFTDAYEPGSTFKIVTAATALDTGNFDLESNFNCVGHKMVENQKIKCWRDYNPHGKQTFIEAVENSCNPAFMTMAVKTGTDAYYDYVYDFGFGEKTGVDVIYEGEGIVRNEKYIQGFDLARIGFGQSIAVTPLQLITAVSAVVNGGELKKPLLIKEILNEKGITVAEFESETIRNVISKKTSNAMKEVLQSVVDNGSGKNAAIEGYKVGGKTGTAQKYDEDGTIMAGKNISSFIGFAPVEDPKFIVLITVDEPSGGSSFGSIVAAPYVKEVLDSALKYANVPSSEVVKPKLVEVPNVLDLPVSDAVAKIADKGFEYVIDGVGTVLNQMPVPGESILKGSKVILYMSEKSQVGDEIKVATVPDLTGLTIDEAKLLTEAKGLVLYCAGKPETISEQNIPVDTEVDVGTIITVK
jgi:stage V sporulation protein D (sporulation-specific penicillin-binding protein)